MALSPKMLAVLQKIEAADAKHFAGLRESARQEAEAATRKRATSRQAVAARAKKGRANDNRRPEPDGTYLRDAPRVE
jgi:hypothetical protein